MSGVDDPTPAPLASTHQKLKSLSEQALRASYRRRGTVRMRVVREWSKRTLALAAVVALAGGAGTPLPANSAALLDAAGVDAAGSGSSTSLAPARTWTPRPQLDAAAPPPSPAAQKVDGPTPVAPGAQALPGARRLPGRPGPEGARAAALERSLLGQAARHVAVASDFPSNPSTAPPLSLR